MMTSSESNHQRVCWFFSSSIALVVTLPVFAGPEQGDFHIQKPQSKEEDPSGSIPFEINVEILAEDREEYDRWVEKLCAKRTSKGPCLLNIGSSKLFEIQKFPNIFCDVDWRSFLIRGKKNADFPKMLLDNEFFWLPLYYANPLHSLRKLSGKLPKSKNVRPDGQVPNSSFFTNTHIPSYSPEHITREFCSYQPTGAMKIEKIKQGGTSEGLWITDESGRTYIIIFDSPFCPEMTTSAEYIGGTLLRIAGYHVPKTSICTVQGTDDPLYDGRRAVATIALENFEGGWRYAEFKDRREIRALQIFGGWINNVDQTEQNTGVTVDENGVCRHYILDFGSSLGSFTFRPQPARLGWTRLFDAYQQFTQPLYDRGIRKVPWQAPYSVHSPAIGYFSADYDPDRWQPFYRNLGFLEVTEADRIWAARRIAQFTEDQIRTIVGLAGYSHDSDAEHVIRTLLQRRQIILDRYLPEQERKR